MIKVEHGRVEISGAGPELSNELMHAVRGVKAALRNSGLPEEFINAVVADAVRHADMTQEERLNDVLEGLGKALHKLCNGTKNEEDTTNDKKSE